MSDERDTGRIKPIRFLDEIPEQMAALRERFEVYRTEIKGRLDNGAEAFVRMSEQLEEVKEMAVEALQRAGAANTAAIAAAQPKPVQWSKVVPIVLALLTTGGGIVWALAKNPDRQEFDAKIGEVQSEIDDLKAGGAQLTNEQIRIRGSLEFQSLSLQRVETKLDQLLVSDKKRGGR